jgi:hypothetical protein
VSLRGELEQLVSPDGLLHPRTVVEWARSHPESELYRQFQWDVEKAAWAYWLHQARQLIIIHVRDDFGQRTVFSLVSDQRHGGGYRDMETVLSTDEMRAEAIQQAFDELRRWRDRFTHLRPELSPIFRVIDRRLAESSPSPPLGGGDHPSPPPP